MSVVVTPSKLILSSFLVPSTFRMGAPLQPGFKNRGSQTRRAATRAGLRRRTPSGAPPKTSASRRETPHGRWLPLKARWTVEWLRQCARHGAGHAPGRTGVSLPMKGGGSAPLLFARRSAVRGVQPPLWTVRARCNGTSKAVCASDKSSRPHVTHPPARDERLDVHGDDAAQDYGWAGAARPPARTGHAGVGHTPALRSAITVRPATNCYRRPHPARCPCRPAVVPPDPPPTAGGTPPPPHRRPTRVWARAARPRAPPTLRIRGTTDRRSWPGPPPEPQRRRRRR